MFPFSRREPGWGRCGIGEKFVLRSEIPPKIERRRVTMYLEKVREHLPRIVFRKNDDAPLVPNRDSGWPVRQFYIPQLNDGLDDFNNLFSLWEQVRKTDGEICLSFNHCRFLRQNAVAFLGGLIASAERMGKNVVPDTDSMRPEVFRHLVHNGFFEAGHASYPLYPESVVPYRQDSPNDWQTCIKSQLIPYLYRHLLEKSWVRMSPRVQSEVVRTIAELYMNAFEHSRSEAGVFSCGQYYPNLSQVGFAIVDFGVGIPATVQAYHAQFKEFPHEVASSVDALKWALARGTSTKNRVHARGMGLDFVTEFMRVNHGVLDIYTSDAVVRVDSHGLVYRSITTSFTGTAINLLLQCDGSKYYQFEDEMYHGALSGGEPAGG